jgi:hypothetical protein
MTLVIDSQNNWKPDQSYDFKSLRPIAQRQIASLLRRMEVTKKCFLYQKEINRVIAYEQNFDRGDSID